MVSYVHTFLVLSYAMYEFALVLSSASFLNFVLFLLFDAVNMVLIIIIIRDEDCFYLLNILVGGKLEFNVSLPILSLVIWEEAVSSVNFLHLLLPSNVHTIHFMCKFVASMLDDASLCSLYGNRCFTVCSVNKISLSL